MSTNCYAQSVTLTNVNAQSTTWFETLAQLEQNQYYSNDYGQIPSLLTKTGLVRDKREADRQKIRKNGEIAY